MNEIDIDSWREVLGALFLGGIGVLFIFAFSGIGKRYCLSFSWLIFSHFLILILGYIGRAIITKIINNKNPVCLEKLSKQTGGNK